jgi:hypothetical protein
MAPKSRKHVALEALIALGFGLIVLGGAALAVKALALDSAARLLNLT